MKLFTYRITPEQYPDLLQRIRPLPKHFDVAGVIPSDDYLFLCVVGSRTHSDYGREACRKIILGLRGQKVVIVSGLAIGIDSIAHEAAIEAGLPTIAFPGSGLSPSALYPASKRDLAERIIVAGGALMSSFQPEQMGAPWTFPTRNRLMAGISHATLIVEGRKGSGTLGTATYATELSRHVMIVPGSIFSELSYGPLLLVKDGAAPVTSAEDVMSELDFIAGRLAKAPRGPERLAETLADMKKQEELRLARKAKQSAPTIPKVNISSLELSPHELTIYKQLESGDKNATELIQETSLPIQTLNVIITELELKGLVAQESGRYYRR